MIRNLVTLAVGGVIGAAIFYFADQNTKRLDQQTQTEIATAQEKIENEKDPILELSRELSNSQTPETTAPSSTWITSLSRETREQVRANAMAAAQAIDQTDLYDLNALNVSIGQLEKDVDSLKAKIKEETGAEPNFLVDEAKIAGEVAAALKDGTIQPEEAKDFAAALVSRDEIATLSRELSPLEEARLFESISIYEPTHEREESK